MSVFCVLCLPLTFIYPPVKPKTFWKIFSEGKNCVVLAAQFIMPAAQGVIFNYILIRGKVLLVKVVSYTPQIHDFGKNRLEQDQTIFKVKLCSLAVKLSLVLPSLLCPKPYILCSQHLTHF